MNHFTPPKSVVKSVAALLQSLSGISVDEELLEHMLEPLFLKVGTRKEIAKYLNVKTDTLKHFLVYSGINPIGTRRGVQVFEFAEVVRAYTEIKRFDDNDRRETDE